jgi:TRAP-type C4-dicarboxylate transport system permease small subunit
MIALGMEFVEFGEIETSPVLSMPKIWVYLAMPFGFGLMFLNTLTLIGECLLQRGDIRHAGQAHAAE